MNDGMGFHVGRQLIEVDASLSALVVPRRRCTQTTWRPKAFVFFRQWSLQCGATRKSRNNGAISSPKRSRKTRLYLTWKHRKLTMIATKVIYLWCYARLVWRLTLTLSSTGVFRASNRALFKMNYIKCKSCRDRRTWEGKYTLTTILFTQMTNVQDGENSTTFSYTQSYSGLELRYAQSRRWSYLRINNSKILGCSNWSESICTQRKNDQTDYWHRSAHAVRLTTAQAAVIITWDQRCWTCFSSAGRTQLGCLRNRKWCRTCP